MFDFHQVPQKINPNDARIMLVYTGGTMGMRRDEAKGAWVPLKFEFLEQYIPELSSIDCGITVAEIKEPIDSSDMDPGLWSELGSLIFKNYDDYDGFVIIHGTDTMAYTASALSYMFEGLEKPIIFTGSQLPIGISRSDARNNLVTSIELALLKRDSKALIREVCIYFDYELFRGNRAKKIESENFDAFHSENYPVLAEAGVDIEMREHYLHRDFESSNLKFNNGFSKEVFIWKIFPGMNIAGIAEILIKAGFKGVVLETYGAGNAPTSEVFLNEIKELTKEGVYILNVSQCLGGSVRQGDYASSVELENLGVIGGKDITSESAVVKMMYLLGNYKETKEIRRQLSISIRGELTD